MLNVEPEDFTVVPLMVEGFAAVVAVEGNTVWLEPEQTTSCGACASSASCGVKGIGSTASRLEARRFALDNPANLQLGERVVVGVPESALLSAALTAYGIPLGTLLGAGIAAQLWAGRDGITLLAMLGGLIVGVVIARLRAKRLSTQGQLAPHYLRRANVSDSCSI